MPRVFTTAGLKAGTTILLIALAATSCRETGDVEVSSIEFRGNSAVTSDQLKEILATRESGFLPWSENRFLDRTEFDRDIKRIQAFYADRGYPKASVTDVDVALNDAKDKVAITIDIDEGEPMIVENVIFEGFDGIPADHLERLRTQLPVSPGQPRDQRLILASHDMSVAELRDHGFAYASVRMLERPGSTDMRVDLTVAGDAGPPAVFGAVTIEGEVSVDEDVIRRELAFSEGDVYQLSRITESQRRIYSLELFQFANVVPRLLENQPTEVPIVVTVAESKHRRLQLAGGYGSEEKARGRINWRHLNFGGDARVGEVEAKASSLEQGLRGSFNEPFLFQRGLSMRVSASTWWANEPVYEYRSSGGRIGLTKDFSRAGFGAERGVRNVVSATLIQEYEDYTIAPGVLEDRTFRDELIALGLDPETGRGSGTVTALELDFSRDTAAQPLDPRQGYVVNGHVEKAGRFLRGTFDYTELLGEVRGYVPVGSRFVWANRARAGTIASPSAALIPFYKRYFVGGSSSVRGWGRYQVSPLTPAGHPIGGRTMIEVSTEARFGIRGKLGGVLFVDGGNVWDDAWEFELNKLRWAVGPGIRYDTPIGPMRVDFGIQLNPIEGLLLEGDPEERKWRVHFSIGQAF